MLAMLMVVLKNLLQLYHTSYIDDGNKCNEIEDLALIGNGLPTHYNKCCYKSSWMHKEEDGVCRGREREKSKQRTHALIRLYRVKAPWPTYT